MVRISAFELKAMLSDRMEDLARQLLPDGIRSGRYWTAFAPEQRNRNSRGIFVWLTGPAAGAWRNAASAEQGDAIDFIAVFACGGSSPPSKDDRTKAFAWARDYLGLSGATPADVIERKREAHKSRLETEEKERLAREVRFRRAYETWLAGKPCGGTIVERYLLLRGIEVRRIPHLEVSLRFKPYVDYWLPGERHSGPAMLGAFRDAEGGFAALHGTWLLPDGSGKADLSPPKGILGAFGGAVIRISKGESGLTPEAAAAAGVAGPVILTEGIETGLTAAMACPEHRVWAVGSISNFGNAPALPCVNAWIVAGEDDTGPQTQKALQSGLEKLAATRLPVTVAGSFGAGDFNDLL